MPIDFAAIDDRLFSNVLKAKQTRIAENDTVEAKANVVVERILNTPIDEHLDELESEIINSEPEKVETAFYPLDPAQSGLIPDFSLDESQVAAINMLVTQQYGCLIGAAGSGKTTCQRFFLQKMIYGDKELGVEPMGLKNLGGKQGLNVALCAFTGIATQVIKSNMPEWLHGACKTIHSLLEYGPVVTEYTNESGEVKEKTIFMPFRHAGNKLDHKVIIIDEASMVGLNLWHELLDACRPGTKIFLTGDLNQLPPVMSQSMFAYVLSEWPVAELTHIHRQKEEAANKIIDVAHSILSGKEFSMDDSKTNVNWRVIGFEVDASPQKAGVQIVNIANAIRNRRVHPSVDPEEPLIYDPYRDRIITAGNGFNDDDPRSMVQQAPLNDMLSRLIEPPSEEHPIYIIDAGRVKKEFATGYRVMATKNEPPDTPDRVTNGMVGKITSIEKNHKWSGNHEAVGPKHIVEETQRLAAVNYFTKTQEQRTIDTLEKLGGLRIEDLDLSSYEAPAEKSKEGGGPASHIVTVEFMNGATRVFDTKAMVESLMLAYASTCHKCQGSQFDTAIIVVHHTVKSQLSREWFYTAVTRATKRVILLYTKHGIRLALANQKIFGRTLAEKIKRYKDLQEEGVGPLKVKVRLYL